MFLQFFPKCIFPFKPGPLAKGILPQITAVHVVMHMAKCPRKLDFRICTSLFTFYLFLVDSTYYVWKKLLYLNQQ